MITTADPLLENCCGCCGDGGCHNQGAINIQSTNPECLRVDTSECGVVKLEPVCPPEVIAGENVTVDVIDCEEGADCSKKYKVNANCKDEKVKACPNDTTPGTLSEKLEAGHGITISADGCDGETDSILRIEVDEDDLKIQYPVIKVNNNSKICKLAVSGDNGHTITISDKENDFYNNVCCLGFQFSKEYNNVETDKYANSKKPYFIGDDDEREYWDLYTGNPAMKTKKGIKILVDGFYRVFGQVTVVNNINNDFYFNLGRGLLRIEGAKDDQGNLIRPELDDWYLSTAKHGAYARQILLKAGEGIDVDNSGKISEGDGNGQTGDGFEGPWMTFNIDTYVDLRAGDVLTVGYRPQSNMKEAQETVGSFRFVGKDDKSTRYPALFGGTVLGVNILAPRLFQDGAPNKVFNTF